MAMQSIWIYTQFPFTHLIALTGQKLMVGFKETGKELLYQEPQTAASPREGQAMGGDCLTAKDGEIQ